MKALKVVFSIIGGVLVIAAAVTAIFVFRDSIEEFYANLKGRCCPRKKTGDEFSDFADV